MLPRSLLAAGLALLALHSQDLCAALAFEPFGKMPDGRPVSIYTLSNKNGMQARIYDLGATLVFVTVPDRNEALADVWLFRASSSKAKNDDTLDSFLGRGQDKKI